MEPSQRNFLTRNFTLTAAVALIIVLWIFSHLGSSQESPATQSVPLQLPTAAEVQHLQSLESSATTVSNPQPSAPPAPAPERILTFTAHDLYAMFHANEVRANIRVRGAKIKFRGTVTEIEQSDFSQTPELKFSADDGNEFDSFSADLQPSQVAQAAKLSKGQLVTLTCDTVSMPYEVLADGCVLD